MKRESGEAFWYAQRVVDVERFRRCRRCCCCLLPPLCFPLRLSLSVCLCVCLSLCACCTEDLAARQSGLPATTEGTVCTVYLVPAIYFFPSRLVLSRSSLHIVFFFFFSNLCLTFRVWQHSRSQILQMGVRAGWRAVTQSLLGAVWDPRCCFLQTIAALLHHRWTIIEALFELGPVHTPISPITVLTVESSVSNWDEYWTWILFQPECHELSCIWSLFGVINLFTHSWTWFKS